MGSVLPNFIFDNPNGNSVGVQICGLHPHFLRGNGDGNSVGDALNGGMNSNSCGYEYICTFSRKGPVMNPVTEPGSATYPIPRGPFAGQFRFMAEFAEKYNSFKPSPSLVEMDPCLEIINQLPELHAHVMENHDLGSMVFSNDSFLSQQPGFHGQYMDGLSGFLPVECSPNVSIGEESKKRKVISVPDTTSGNCSEIGECSKSKRKNGSGRGKRGRDSAKEVEKQKEVVHVRARRGQATDSHSLAERVRREKINERMRYLQDLVPGCYKTMGMAVMLDEIINYVQSLQNQVEFLSMKLSAASSFHEVGLEMDAIEMSQVLPRVSNLPYEIQEVDRLIREGYGGCSSFHSTMPF